MHIVHIIEWAWYICLTILLLCAAGIVISYAMVIAGKWMNIELADRAQRLADWSLRLALVSSLSFFIALFASVVVSVLRDLREEPRSRREHQHSRSRETTAR